VGGALGSVNIGCYAFHESFAHLPNTDTVPGAFQETEFLRTCFSLILMSVGVFSPECVHGLRKNECAVCVNPNKVCARQDIALRRVVPEPRPKYARRKNLHSRFPSQDYLRRLVADKGYDPAAAHAAFATPLRRTPDRRKTSIPDADNVSEFTVSYQSLNFGDNFNLPHPARRTKVGGGFTEDQVLRGLDKMRTDNQTKDALYRIVYQRTSTMGISNETGIPLEKLYVYASRLRCHIRQELSG
jgi:hypothetical protein